MEHAVEALRLIEAEAGNEPVGSLSVERVAIYRDRLERFDKATMTRADHCSICDVPMLQCSKTPARMVIHLDFKNYASLVTSRVAPLLAPRRPQQVKVCERRCAAGEL